MSTFIPLSLRRQRLKISFFSAYAIAAMLLGIAPLPAQADEPRPVTRYEFIYDANGAVTNLNGYPPWVSKKIVSGELCGCWTQTEIIDICVTHGFNSRRGMQGRSQLMKRRAGALESIASGRLERCNEGVGPCFFMSRPAPTECASAGYIRSVANACAYELPGICGSMLTPLTDREIGVNVAGGSIPLHRMKRKSLEVRISHDKEHLNRIKDPKNTGIEYQQIRSLFNDNAEYLECLYAGDESWNFNQRSILNFIVSDVVLAIQTKNILMNAYFIAGNLEVCPQGLTEAYPLFSEYRKKIGHDFSRLNHQ